MNDTFTSEKRSEVMRAVRSKGNKSTEIKLIALFKEYSIKGWRRNSNTFGNPDFMFPKQKIAVFADGCFWHGHNCRNTTPSDNADYWKVKILKNHKRDKLVKRTLKEKGWYVVRIWECEIKKGAKHKLNRIKKKLENE